ncbi:unnamed protein product [Pieris macdunnoughi]|uniref:RNA-directed DNA polymerase n=1 Tax=Pieris macdunnoughi TaxID=345717 RepID=A0A821TH61_9NEOP|nr:unnamed protein product [Pieris macdunnoughi]
MMATMAAGGPGDPHTQMNTYRSYVTMLADPGAKDEIKLKAAQELSENFEVILSSPQYPQFLEHSLKIFLKILQEGEPHFIAEYNIQQVRKLILEMIHRLPISETLRPYVKSILILMLKLMEIENEENVLVCLKIFMELHKQYRPAYSTDVDIHKFLQWVKAIYSDLPNHLPKIFEPRPSIRVKDLSEVNIDQLLLETYTTTPIHTEKKLLDGSVVTYNLIPKSVISLKVIQELPIIVVLMYQLYKQNVHQEVSNFIPLIMDTITLQPSATLRQSATFNKEVFVDFMGAQIKTLAFLAYIIRIYQDTIANHATMMVKGIIGLLTLCPPEVAHLRKELVIATRHILATDLRLKFVPYMERLFDEDVLLGGGWTVHESLRPLAYSTLADLVHHVRQHLPLSDLAIAAHLFSKNVHDESLPTSIQTMSCKLLLNLVDCIRQRSESENAAGTQPQGRQLLMRILEVFVLKFKTMSKLQLPALMAKYKQACPTPAPTPTNGSPPTNPNTPTATVPTTVEVKVEEEKPTTDFLDSLNKVEEKSKIGFPTSQMSNLNVGDYRTLVKTLVCGVKTITWGCASCKTSTTAEGTSTTTVAGQKQHVSARETLVYIRLVVWGLQSLDIYTLSAPRQPVHTPSQPHVRSKEEKEVLEHFSGVFSMMNPQTFQEIFTATISHMVERINKNTTLQIIANTFLSNPATSPIFATVLVEYLLKRMEEMGSNVERSNLYLRLFKLVFGSVSLFPTENEQMLRPHLHSIVNKAMDYAMTAKEPYNYFLLLRALFRSIGGGSHDLLYQEFLPLLPNLLEGLNRLQSGLHKQHMKDLFVELCLTVPVRLSSLLPYLPMLMDPLVSALNGSHTLISQGLRTLELCVDNLQPDFLYEHIQPVRADLMQALWRTLQNSEVARIAFRVLGKFGGGNRKMMIEPQRLEYRETDAPPPAVMAYFQDQAKPIDFEVDKVIETAFSALKSSTTDPFYRRQCWEVLRCYLAASLNLEDDRPTLQKLFNHPSFLEGKIPAQSGPYYKCSNSIVRNTHKTALTGMFVAAAIKELRQHVLPTMVSLVRHYTLVAIAQEAGPFAGSGGPKEGLDALVLVDAIAVVMGHEEKELCKPGHLALVLMIETAATVLGSKERACKLPLMEYLAERMSSLCYERAWYAKLGGCIAVKFMFEKMAPEWVYKHVFTFLKAVLFVMMDLTGEVSSGALDMATVNLERLVRVCVTGPGGQAIELDGEVAAARTRALHDVLQELVLQVTSPHLLVRQQAMKSLELIAELQNKSVTDVMDPHREVLSDIIPPKKHLLRHQPANAQMGLMDGTTFCTTLKPRLFTIDLNVNEHKVFFRELLSLCEAEDAMLGKLPCYKGVNLIPLRISALRALAACHYIQEKHCREKIFQVLYKSLEKNDTELQQAGFECMQKFLAGFQIDMDMVHPVMRPLLLTLGDHRNLSVNGAKRLSYLTQLFPSTFSEKLCEQLLQLLKKLLDYSIQTNRGGNFLQSVSKNMENEQKIIILIGIFHQIPAASPRFIDVLCRLIFHTEKSLMIEAGSPFRDPLVKFLLRYPKETLDLIMSDNNIKDQQWSRFLVFLVKHEEAGQAFREALQTTKKARLLQLLAANSGTNLSQPDKIEMQFQAIRVISLLIKFDDQWLSTQHDLIELLKRIWCTDQYQETHKKVENVECSHWKEPKLIVKILLHYFCHHPSNIDLLFQLLRALCDRFIPDFQVRTSFLVCYIPLSLLVDSGSAICLLKESSIHINQKLNKELIKIKGIDPGDEPTQTEGHFQLKLKISKTKSIPFKFHVVKNINLPYDGILGTDFLTNFGCKIDYTNDILKIGNESVKLHFSKPFYIIPPRSESVIECSVQETKLKEGIITDQHLSNNLFISNCIVRVKDNNRINLTIANTSENSAHVKPNLNLNIEPLCQMSYSINTMNQRTLDRTEEVIESLRTDHLNQEERSALIELCSQYSDIFHLPDDQLTHTSALEHHIKTTSNVPVHTKSYRFPECHKKEVETQISKMIDDKIIEHSSSPWSSPIWIVPKKLDSQGQRSWRIVIDYRKLNDITIGETYPIPQISEILDQLAYPDFSQPFILTCDASNYAISAILSQGQIGQDRPIAFASRTMNKAECNYSVTEKECLAILFGTKTFRPYLYGNRFTVVTDHKPLQWLFNCKDPGSRLIRWRLKLEEFEYDIKYKKGKINSNADALSRYPVNPVQPEPNPEGGGEPVDKDLMDLLISPPSFHPEELLSPNFNPTTLDGDDLLPLPELEPNSTSSALPNQMTGSPVQIPEVTPQLPQEQPTGQNIYDDPMPSTSANPDLPVDDYPTFLKSIANKDKNFNVNIEEFNESLIKTNSKVILVPTSIDLDESNPYVLDILTDPEILEKAQNSEKELFSFQKIEFNNKMYYFIFTKVHHFDEASYPEIFQTLKNIRNELVIFGNTDEIAISDMKNPFEKHSFIKIYNILCYLFHNAQIKIKIYHNNIIYPAPVEIKKILFDNHDIPIAGHLGSVRMYDRIKQSYYWKGMRSDIESYVKQCKSCQENKALRKLNRAPMRITSTSSEPCQRISMDIVGPLPETGPAKLRFILTFQDDLTKFSSAYPIRSTTAEETSECLLHYISIFGIPKSILTDQGTNFTSDLFKKTCEFLKIKNLWASPYHPQTQGALERSHSTLKEYLKSYINKEQSNWPRYVYTAMLAYNTSVHSTTHFTPYELIFGNKPFIPNSIFNESLGATYPDYVRMLQNRLKHSREKALDFIKKSKESSKSYYDLHTRTIKYKAGEYVYLKNHLRLRKASLHYGKDPIK